MSWPRRSGASSCDTGPAVPLPDLDAVEDFFISLAWGGNLYGWEFFDVPERTKDWPLQVSLTVDISASPAPHTFYWFNECGRSDGTGTTSYCIERTVAFEGLMVVRSDGALVPLDQFIADGRRVWDGLHAHDERMSVETQRKAQQGTPKWRAWAELPAQ